MGTRTLTRREIECVRLAGQGLSDKEIAQRLRIGHKTVSNHLANAYQKLQVQDRKEAARRLGNDYPVSPIPIHQPDAISLNGPVAVGPIEGPADGRLQGRRTLYGAYAALGSWRRPPRVGGSVLWLIILWALGTVLLLGAGAAVMLTVFEALDRFPQAARL